MGAGELNVVTGGFGYTGQYIAGCCPWANGSERSRGIPAGRTRSAARWALISSAGLAVAAARPAGHAILDAVGPETYTFRELVCLLARTIRSGARVIHVKPALARFLCRAVGRMVRDVILTADELEGLMANLLVSDLPPLGRTSLARWLNDNAERVGVRYASELARHYRR